MLQRIPYIALGALLLGAGAVAAAESTSSSTSVHALPAPSEPGGLVVGLCDGETALEVKGKKAGDKLTKKEAQAVSDALMAEWRQKNPDARWDDAPPVVAQAKKPQPKPAPGKPGQPVDLRAPAAGSSGREVAREQHVPVQDGHTYGAFDARDELVWEASMQQFVAEGRRVFHDAEAVGGTVGISCDMCHPDGANTHPETYPKYQVQLGRVALLRDMINWCIENPARGKPLAEEDPRMKAMEAYIMAQRMGVAMEPGKH